MFYSILNEQLVIVIRYFCFLFDSFQRSRLSLFQINNICSLFLLIFVKLVIVLVISHMVFRLILQPSWLQIIDARAITNQETTCQLNDTSPLASHGKCISDRKINQCHPKNVLNTLGFAPLVFIQRRVLWKCQIPWLFCLVLIYNQCTSCEVDQLIFGQKNM